MNSLSDGFSFWLLLSCGIGLGRLRSGGGDSGEGGSSSKGILLISLVRLRELLE
jgi:hypothetical protein